MTKLVHLISPYSASNGRTVEENVEYARQALYDCLERGESPYASHLLYTQVLADAEPEQRELAIKAGSAWASMADIAVVYQDHGISEGMRQDILVAKSRGKYVEFRSLANSPD